MDFLPIEKAGYKVYAGFWNRFGASFVDILVCIPFLFLYAYIDTISIYVSVIALVTFGVIFSCYRPYFHYKYGATIGKMAFWIKVTKPNGSQISLKDAFLRSSVDIVFATFMVIARVIAYFTVDPEIYINLGFMDRVKYLLALLPNWFGYFDILNNLWIVVGLLLLLINKRKRTLHDYIAGTVVVNEQSLEEAQK